MTVPNGASTVTSALAGWVPSDASSGAQFFHPHRQAPIHHPVRTDKAR
jgi:hypothetical protein